MTASSIDIKKGRVRWTRPFLCVALSIGSTSGFAAPPLPDDVTRFLERRIDCDHWTGEEPYDAERRAEIEANIRDLRCVSIERDEQRLRRRYAKRPDALKALAQAE